MELWEGCICWLRLVVIAMLGSTPLIHGHYFGNALPEEDAMPTCEEQLAQIQVRESHTYAAYPPELKGHWVSSECETRPGPEFLLRNYRFEKDRTFKLIQHYYGDDSCTSPLYTLTAKGQLHLRGQSWLVPGAADADYTLHKVSIVTYSNEVLDEVTLRLNQTCPGYVSKPWRVHKSYVIYSYLEKTQRLVQRATHSSNPKQPQQTSEKLQSNSSKKAQQKRHVVHQHTDEIEEIDCLSALHVVFHELQLLRSERRKALQLASSPTYLFLGDIHPQLHQRSSYRPTAYQLPLLKVHEMDHCPICKAVAKSNERSPPHLHAKPRLPVYPYGDWVSQRCETRSIGTFLTRRVKMIPPIPTPKSYALPTPPTFQVLIQYYSDPFCKSPTFSVLAQGSYKPGPDSELVQGGTEYDFYIESLTITPQTDGFVMNLNGHRGNVCGRDHSWVLGVPQDITTTGGCQGLGIKVPSTAYDLLKMSLNDDGQPWLHFGILETNHEVTVEYNGRLSRPTAYQPPLAQCKSNVRDLLNEEDNNLFPVFNARTASSSQSITSNMPVIVASIVAAMRCLI